jgi:hypothetical protein
MKVRERLSICSISPVLEAAGRGFQAGSSPAMNLVEVFQMGFNLFED